MAQVLANETLSAKVDWEVGTHELWAPTSDVK